MDCGIVPKVPNDFASVGVEPLLRHKYRALSGLFTLINSILRKSYIQSMQSKGSLMKMFGFGKKAKEEKESSSSNPPGNNSVAAANSNDSNDSQNSVRVMSSADSKDVIPYDLPMKRSSGVLSKQRLSVDGREANLAPTPTGFGLTRESSDCTAFSEVDMGAVLTATTPPPKEKRDSGIFKAMGKWSLDSAEKKRPSVTKEGLTAQHVAAKSTKSNTIRPRIMKFDKLKLPMDVLLKSLLKIRSKEGKTTRFSVLILLYVIFIFL